MFTGKQRELKGAVLLIDRFLSCIRIIQLSTLTAECDCYKEFECFDFNLTIYTKN